MIRRTVKLVCYNIAFPLLHFLVITKILPTTIVMSTLLLCLLFGEILYLSFLHYWYVT